MCCYNPETNEIIGTPYSYNGLISDNIELAYRYNIVGEHWGIVNTGLLKSLLFPIIKGHFYNENYLWFSFAKLGYKVICYNEPLRAYHIVLSSLSHNKSYKFDKERIYMELHFTTWKICNVGHLIFRYSKIAFANLFIELFKEILKLILSYIVKLKS